MFPYDPPNAKDAVTFLFVPADRPDRFSSALRAGADVVVLDLEDAVSPEAKSHARDTLRVRWAELISEARNRGVLICVRINSLKEAEAIEDLNLCHLLVPALIMVPKMESAQQLSLLQAVAPDAGVIALIETAEGVFASRDIARVRNVCRLALGAVDLMLDLGVHDDREPLDFARSTLVAASASARLGGPIDAVCMAVADIDGVRASAQRARLFGYAGKLCIHPLQIGPVEEAFAVNDSEIEWATRVLEVDASASGAATILDGRLVDAPVVERAVRTLARARAGKSSSAARLVE